MSFVVACKFMFNEERERERERDGWEKEGLKNP
jgi:hypothetical protein